MAAITTTHPQYNRLPPMPTDGGSAMLTRLFEDQLFGEAGDILKVCPLARGMVIGAGTMVQTGDHDTSTGHVFSVEVTNGTVTKTVIDGSTAGQAGGLARPSKAPATEDGVGFVVPDNTYHLRLICDTAATGEQAADVLVQVEIGGARDNQLTE